jgi:hypothetical protein
VSREEEYRRIIEAVQAFDQDPVVYNLKSLLVGTQFLQIQGAPMETYEFDMKLSKLVPVGYTDYAARTRLIANMLFVHASQYYPELFTGDIGDEEVS